mgnify:CR=1 FL=1|jgi:hypothetical protein
MNEVEFYLEDLKSKFNKINPNEYILSYSGGRDSELLRVIIKEYLKLPIPIIALNTRLEHDEIHRRMLDNVDDILHSNYTIYDVKEKYGIPCFNKSHDEKIDSYQKGSRCKSTVDYISGVKLPPFAIPKYARDLLYAGKLHKISSMCCTKIKKEPFYKYEKKYNKKSIIAITLGEGVIRKSKYTSCFTKKKTFTPLFDLKPSLAHKIEAYFNVEIPEVYNVVPRTGCCGCPYGKYPIQELLMLQENKYNYIYNCFKESYLVKKRIATRLL